MKRNRITRKSGQVHYTSDKITISHGYFHVGDDDLGPVLIPIEDVISITLSSY